MGSFNLGSTNLMGIIAVVLHGSVFYGTPGVGDIFWGGGQEGGQVFWLICLLCKAQ